MMIDKMAEVIFLMLSPLYIWLQNGHTDFDIIIFTSCKVNMIVCADPNMYCKTYFWPIPGPNSYLFRVGNSKRSESFPSFNTQNKFFSTVWQVTKLKTTMLTKTQMTSWFITFIHMINMHSSTEPSPGIQTDGEATPIDEVANQSTQNLVKYSREKAIYRQTRVGRGGS